MLYNNDYLNAKGDIMKAFLPHPVTCESRPLQIQLSGDPVGCRSRVLTGVAYCTVGR
jgi:hypothetical protein